MANYRDEKWQNSMKISLDYNNMMSFMIGENHGLKQNEIDSMLEKAKLAHKQVFTKSGKGNDFLGFLDLPNKSQDEINKIKEVANSLADNSDIFISLGIGGSYLGAKALFDALKSPYYNELSREKRNNRPRIYFEGNNLDSDSINYLFDLLPSKNTGDVRDKFSVAVISKSGTTIETALSFRLFQEKSKEFYGNEHNKYIIAITDQAKGKLKDISDKENYESFVIPDNVGGRYSVLTPVGLLPAAVIGIDIEQLIAGAKYMKQICESDNIKENPAIMYAVIQYLSYKKGKNISAMAAWAKCLESVGFWYDQLSAESLGKDGQGRVPFTIVNNRDLHSRGQELQDGEHNTVVTNLFIQKSNRDITFTKNELDLDSLNYLDGKTVKSMQFGALEGTNYAYASAQRPTMNILIPELNEFTLGQLFYMFEVSTVIEGYLNDINPLDQPGVEAYKKFMFANLGREDMKKYKEEFDSRQKSKAEFII
ncbi:MAG: glucose-6-phosphate isomerase [Candidatus Sericytochromatia bacterium]